MIRRLRARGNMIEAVVYGWLLAITIGVAIALWSAYSAQGNINTVVRESAATRITTVTQRCALTALDAAFAQNASTIIGEFAPQASQPFEALRSRYLTSLKGCEKQLAQVKAINRRAG